MKTSVYSLYGLSIFSFIMSFIWIPSSSQGGMVGGGALSLVFTTIAMFAVFVAAGLKHVNKRLDEIEKKVLNSEGDERADDGP